jgi:hypothetical protein
MGRWAWLNKFSGGKTGDFGEDLRQSGEFSWPDDFDKMGRDGFRDFCLAENAKNRDQ